MPIVTRLYPRHEDAARIVRALKTGGIEEADISLVASHGDGDAIETEDPDITPEAVGAGKGEAIGAAIGGGAGLLAGLGLLTIPGLGLVVAAGWLVAAVTGAGAGAAAGSLIGALVGAGVDEEHAHRHVEDIKGGAVLVTVRADAANSLIAARIMDGDQR
jgi:hypothetical protein